MVSGSICSDEGSKNSDITESSGGQERSDALILDMTHGGYIIAERLVDMGWAVTCVDVYHNSTEECRERLAAKGLKALDEAPPEHFDIVFMPAHCPDSFIGGAVCDRKMTFSEAVGMLIEDDLPFRIEVTGVKGKTSTCYLVAHALSSIGKKVFLHSPRGQGPYEGHHEVTACRSIAPPSILELPDTGYDVVISEVSLGGSGKADIAVITNLVDDYGIAKNTRKASSAKAQALTPKVNIVREDEKGLWGSLRPDVELTTYSDNCHVIGTQKLGEPLKIEFIYKGETAQALLDGSYLSRQYLPSIDIALKVLEAMDVPLKDVIASLESFRGVPGRGEVSGKEGCWRITERNPGISHISIGMTMGCLKELGALDNCLVVVDPVSKKVCDKMKAPLIKEVLDGYGVDYVITDGKGGYVDPSGHTTVVTFVKEAWQ